MAEVPSAPPPVDAAQPPAPAAAPADPEKPPERTPEQLAIAARERDFVKQLVRLWRRRRLYGTGHTTIQEDLDRFFSFATDMLSKYGPVGIGVESRSFLSLFVKDELLIEDQREEGDLANRLFMEGFRELVFQPGLTREEVVELIEIWSLNLNSPEYFEDTLATLMWKAEFPHVKYDAVSGFEDACKFIGGTGAGGPGGAEGMLARVQEALLPTAAARPKGPGAAPGAGGGGGGGGGGTGGGGGGRPGIAPVGRPGAGPGNRIEGQRYKLTAGLAKERIASIDTITTEDGDDVESVNVKPDEMADLKKEILEQKHAEDCMRLNNLVLSIATRQSDMLPLQQASTYVLTAMDALLEDGHVDAWYRDLDHLGWVSKPGPFDVPGPTAPAAKAMLQELVTPQRVAKLLRHIDPRIPSQVSRFSNALRLADRDRAEDTFAALEAATAPPARRRICHLLIEFSDQRLDWFGKRLHHRDPRVVRDVLYCILAIGGPDSYTWFVKVQRHPNPEVRREALTLLKHHMNDDVKRILLGSLRDKSEENRLVGLSQVEAAQLREALGPLREIALGEDFRKRSSEEKHAVARALVAVAGLDAIPVLKQLLEPKFALLDRQAARDVQLAAAEGLGMIDHPKARIALNDMRHEVHKDVHAAISLILSKQESEEANAATDGDDSDEPAQAEAELEGGQAPSLPREE